MKIIDNITTTLKDELFKTIKEGSVVNVAAASFSMYAYNELKKQLSNISEFNFIFTEKTFTKEKTSKEKREFNIPRINRESSLYGTEFEIKLRNELTQKAISKECATWVRKKCKFKSNITNEKMPGFMTVVNDDSENNVNAYLPILDFSTVSLGVERGNYAYQPITNIDGEVTKTYLNIFKEQWNDDNKLEDVTSEVLENIEMAYAENAPEFIYYLTVYHIFTEFLEDISEDNLADSAIGFKESKIYKLLYDFQKDAVLAIINKLETYNGCILADSVGLGKTFTALAVIKYYEEKNKSVLVLCPKKLSDNWNTFKENYKNNPIAEDRLNYKVLYHTDIQREKGNSNGTDLSKLRWDNYNLVVIDESHNFRNGEGTHVSDKENRYEKLMRKVIKGQVKTKVLMLSATPVNNRFTDLKHQLRLIYEDKPELLDSKLNTEKSIDDIFTQAQRAYTTWSKYDRKDRTTDNLQKMINPDFFTLLDSVTIARSRRHIEKYYNIDDIGKFPNRLKPISLVSPLTDIKDVPSYSDINNMTLSLNLSVYMPTSYIQESKLDKYVDEDLIGITQVGRESGIVKLMSINLLKRLESSVHAFRLTLSRIENLINETIKSINDFESHKSVSKIDTRQIDTEDFDFDDQNNDFLIGKSFKIDLNDMDYKSWKRDLMSDRDLISKMIFEMNKITPEHDLKLQKMKEYIYNKVSNPFNENNKKVLIFSAFADTTIYLYDNLNKCIMKDLGLHSAMVTGSSEGKTTIKGLQNDLNSVLTCFSPVSKSKDLLFPDMFDDISILFGTDCISEGQNLQDCDTVVNYDIHWNPIRIIQRFGRVDRIGSKNKDIQLVNFWPDMALDEYIKLKDRVESRMKAGIMVATGDENPIDLDENGDLEYRATQLKKLQEEVFDVEEMSESISITDLGLNEFRLDLVDYVKENGKEILESKPKGMHTVVAKNNDLSEGVIFVLKNVNESINKDKRNRIHPFYMVYISKDGEIICDYLSPKKMLDDIRLLCREKKEAIKDLYIKFNKETNDGKDMKKISDLLNKSINSIIESKEMTDADSLFTPGGTTALKSKIRGLEDFELISFIVIK